MKDAVRDQNLADMCSIFGNENGMKLWQSGGDIAEVKTWQSLNEKYAQYLPKADTSLSDDDEDKPTDPEEELPTKDEDPPKKDDEENKLSAAGLTKLTEMVKEQTKLIESQSAEITKLKAAIPQATFNIMTLASIHCDKNFL
jgi:recombination DNA repair RAD52 pathway protein